jgi:hypothetical protein
LRLNFVRGEGDWFLGLGHRGEEGEPGDLTCRFGELEAFSSANLFKGSPNVVRARPRGVLGRGAGEGDRDLGGDGDARTGRGILEGVNGRGGG